MDNRRLKRELIKDFISKGWRKGKATKQVTAMCKEETKRDNYVNKFLSFLIKNNINTIELKAVNSLGVDAYVCFSLTSNEAVSTDTICDIVISDKPKDGEIDFNALDISAFHMIAAFQSIQYEEDKKENPKYMIRILYNAFMYTIKEPKFKVLENLRKEYNRVNK